MDVTRRFVFLLLRRQPSSKPVHVTTPLRAVVVGGGGPGGYNYGAGGGGGVVGPTPGDLFGCGGRRGLVADSPGGLDFLGAGSDGLRRVCWPGLLQRPPWALV